ncbi:hypothetical protein GCAAIG_01145 [Candidatus Electronema halotolerans]
MKLIRLQGIIPWVHHYYWSHPFFIFQQMINERLKNIVQLDYAGDSSFVPIFDQFDAVESGAADVALGISSYYTHRIPEAMCVLYSHHSPAQLRTNGFYEYFRELHLRKGNVVYLANTGGVCKTAFRLFFNKKIADCDSVKGLRVRTLPVYVSLVKALGGIPVSIKPTDLLAALKKNEIDGYGWSYGGIASYGWENLTKYVLEHSFYSANTCLLINKSKWDSFPAEVRIELEQIGCDLELEAERAMRAYNKNEDVFLKGLNIDFLSFSDEEKQRFIKTAYDAGWSSLSVQDDDELNKLQLYLTGG